MRLLLESALEWLAVSSVDIVLYYTSGYAAFYAEPFHEDYSIYAIGRFIFIHANPEHNRL